MVIYLDPRSLRPLRAGDSPHEIRRVRVDTAARLDPANQVADGRAAAQAQFRGDSPCTRSARWP